MFLSVNYHKRASPIISMNLVRCCYQFNFPIRRSRIIILSWLIVFPAFIVNAQTIQQPPGPNISVPPAASSTPVTSEELVAHFERTTTQVMNTFNTIAIIIGVLGGASGVLGAIFVFIGNKELSGLTKETETLQKKLQGFQGEIV